MPKGAEFAIRTRFEHATHRQGRNRPSRHHFAGIGGLIRSEVCTFPDRMAWKMF
jgi:hypothetical protein